MAGDMDLQFYKKIADYEVESSFAFKTNYYIFPCVLYWILNIYFYRIFRMMYVENILWTLDILQGKNRYKIQEKTV